MKIRALYKNETVYILGFGFAGLSLTQAIISRNNYGRNATVEAVNLREVFIIDNKYNPYYEE
jgi:hypothetical protein